jgi:uncharacterized membrane protein YsdA (DUF1294 family)/cold shock CspA family protein
MSSLRKGTLTTWKDDKGFGFIKPLNTEGDEIFIHITGFRTGIERRPLPGDIISYQVTRDDNTGKLRAYNAHIKGISYVKRKPHSSKHFPVEEMIAQLFLLFPFGCSFYVLWTAANPFPLIIYSLMSVITTVLYKVDKNRAQQNAWRISETSLHIAEFLGGWPGALVSQYNFRHKNAKFSYQFVFWVIVFVHEIGWVSYLVLKGFP